MSTARCGCDALRAARQKRDPVEREQETQLGEMLRERWACPGSCAEEPARGTEHPDCLDALDATRNLVGVEGLRTCPHWYMRLPWVATAFRAYRWREKGALHMRVRHVTGALGDAIDAIDDGLAARHEYEFQKMREQRNKPPPATPPKDPNDHG
jgi:hypothetical protein